MSVLDVERKRFTVDELERLAEAGVLPEDERVELIDGDLIPMNPIGPLHAAVVTRLDRELGRHLSAEVIVRVQNPLVLAADQEFQPDIAVLRPEPAEYATRHPGAADCLLVVEVADTTLARDLEVKLPRYAAAQVPELWVIDLVHQEVLVHTEPSAGRYGSVRTLRRGDTLTAAVVGGLSLPLQAILR